MKKMQEEQAKQAPAGEETPKEDNVRDAEYKKTTKVLILLKKKSQRRKNQKLNKFFEVRPLD